MTFGKRMVVDASAILSLIFPEPTAPWVLKQIQSHRSRLLVSTVTLAEVLIILRTRLKEGAEREESLLLASDFEFVAPTVEQAQLAAAARVKFPLNIGDCFVYALSAVENVPILTLDEDFRSCDRPVLIPQSRREQK
jgi:uncharacterized protein with PIN domain